ncbi:ATPase inhibitor subunit zeta [Alsobacter sp. R-9]
MTEFAEIGRLALRNRLLGRWAAARLGKAGPDAKVYEDALVALAASNGDIFARLRHDLDAAGVVVSDEEIGVEITTSTVRAGTLLGGPSSGGGDSAAVALKRNIMSR